MATAIIPAIGRRKYTTTTGTWAARTRKRTVIQVVYVVIYHKFVRIS